MNQWILRGTKRKRLREMCTEGLTRPSNAWFRYTPLASNDALLAALTLCFYFGVSSERVAPSSSYSGSLAEIYAEKPDLTPVVVFARFLPGGMSHECTYDVTLPNLVARSLPYTKVAVAGKLDPFREFQVLAPSLKDIAAVERELVHFVAPPGTARFFAKVSDWPESAVKCPPSLTMRTDARKDYETAVLCERLAHRLLPDLVTRISLDSEENA